MDNNFSAQVKEIISYSREEALRLGNDFIGTEHLLLGLIREGDNTAIRILKSFNVDLYELRKEIEQAEELSARKDAQDLLQHAFRAAVAIEKVVHDGDLALCRFHPNLPCKFASHSTVHGIITGKWLTESPQHHPRRAGAWREVTRTACEACLIPARPEA